MKRPTRLRLLLQRFQECQQQTDRYRSRVAQLEVEKIYLRDRLKFSEEQLKRGWKREVRKRGGGGPPQDLPPELSPAEYKTRADDSRSLYDELQRTKQTNERLSDERTLLGEVVAAFFQSPPKTEADLAELRRRYSVSGLERSHSHDLVVHLLCGSSEMEFLGKLERALLSGPSLQAEDLRCDGGSAFCTPLLNENRNVDHSNISCRVRVGSRTVEMSRPTATPAKQGEQEEPRTSVLEEDLQNTAVRNRYILKRTPTSGARQTQSGRDRDDHPPADESVEDHSTRTPTLKSPPEDRVGPGPSPLHAHSSPVLVRPQEEPAQRPRSTSDVPPTKSMIPSMPPSEGKTEIERLRAEVELLQYRNSILQQQLKLCRSKVISRPSSTRSLSGSGAAPGSGRTTPTVNPPAGGLADGRGVGVPVAANNGNDLHRRSAAGAAPNSEHAVPPIMLLEPSSVEPAARRGGSSSSTVRPGGIMAADEEVAEPRSASAQQEFPRRVPSTTTSAPRGTIPGRPRNDSSQQDVDQEVRVRRGRGADDEGGPHQLGVRGPPSAEEMIRLTPPASSTPKP